jgi:transcriptional regulator with XRE-family HTH domain
MNLAQRIRAKRQQLGLSQFGLALELEEKHKVKVSQGLISLLENGHLKSASEETIKRICAALGVEVTPADLRQFQTTRDEQPAPQSIMYCPNEFCPNAEPVHNGDRWYIVPFFSPVSNPCIEHTCPFCSASLSYVCNEPSCARPAVHRTGLCPNGHPLVGIKKRNVNAGPTNAAWLQQRENNQRWRSTLLQRAEVEKLLLGDAPTQPVSMTDGLTLPEEDPSIEAETTEQA